MRGVAASVPHLFGLCKLLPMSRRRFCRGFVLVALAVGLTLGLTGCFGGDDEGGPTTDTTSAESSTTPTPTAPAPRPPTPPEPVQPPVITVEIPELPVAPLPEPPVAVPPPPEPPRGTGPLVYTVEQGDTLFSIARKFEVSVDILIETNNIDNPDVIFVEQELVIPPPG